MRCASSIAVWGLCLAGSAFLYAQGPPEEAAAARIEFEDGSQSSGLSSFTFVSGGPEQEYIIEAMGGGVCLLDYDGDGFLDIYFVNGGQVDSFKAGSPSGLRNALYRNQGDRTFHDVTEEAGVPGNGTWGHGCSVADYNNDRRPDLYVANYGPNILYRNLGGGRFEDVTATAGVNDPRWSTGSAWADYNGDGWPDLFVANYMTLDPGNLPEPGSKEYGTMAGAGAAASGCVYDGVPVMCGPSGLPGAGDTLFRNNGDGTFADVSKEAGVDDPDEYYGLGVLWCDFDNDTHPDLYVANDTQGNYLYRNRGDGTFEEMGFLSGVAVNEQGSEQSGMGVSCGDYENKGLLGIYVTNFADDTSTLYRNDGQMNFLDITFAAGLGPVTLPFVSFVTFFFDVDNDGWLDLFVATGHVYPQIEKVTDLKTYRERNQLFRNLGNGHFQEVAEKALGIQLAVSRGAVWGDLDNDGALDVIVTNLNDPPTLLWNRTEPRQNYLVVALEGTRSNRDALGARVRLRTGSHWQLREVQSGGSYLCGHDRRLHFGLGKAAVVDEVQVWWPSGATAVLREVPANQFLTLREPPPEPETAQASPSPEKD
jgi:hypothetical protein